MPTDALGARIHGERRVEREFGAVGELHLARHESIDADLRALQVAEHAHVAAGAACAASRTSSQAPRVIGGVAVGEIEAHHIDAGADHVRENLRVVGRRAEGRDDFCAALE